MSKKGMIRVVLMAEVKDKAKAKEKLPAMIDNARKFPGVVNFDFCEIVGEANKYSMWAAFESEDAWNKFKNHDRMKEIRENGKENYKGDWTVKSFKVLY